MSENDRNAIIQRLSWSLEKFAQGKHYGECNKILEILKLLDDVRDDSYYD